MIHVDAHGKRSNVIIMFQCPVQSFIWVHNTHFQLHYTRYPYDFQLNGNAQNAYNFPNNEYDRSKRQQHTSTEQHRRPTKKKKKQQPENKAKKGQARTNRSEMIEQFFAGVVVLVNVVVAYW